jgi:type IV pilus biogenesis protein CpaD/CtpE
MIAAAWLLCGGVAMVMTLTGCGGDTANYLDPYTKPYAWHPTGAPTANLAAQLANPHDLVVGRGTNEGDSKEAAGAIERVWQDRPKPIVSSNSGGGSAASAGASAGSAGGSGTGGSN